MATVEEMQRAAACLTAVFPQFVATELADLTDKLTAAIQSITDPLAALADQSVEGIVEDVGAISEGDIWDNLAAGAAGLGAQYATREASGFVSDMTTKYPEATKKSQKIANKSELFLNSTWTALTLLPDMPYAAAQRICSIMIRVANLKIANLECAKKHVVQVTNLIFVLLKNIENYKDSTFSDIESAKNLVRAALVEINRSAVLFNGQVAFDVAAIGRAQDELEKASMVLSPAKGKLSILDTGVILTAGSADPAYTSAENRSLATIVIPSLARILEQEAFAFRQHVDVYNRYLDSLVFAVSRYRSAGQSNRLLQQRLRALTSIRERLTALCDSMEGILRRKSTRQASFLTIQYVSRIKSIIVEIDRLSQTELTEGSIEGPLKAAELADALDTTIASLVSLSNTNTVSGIEDPLALQTQLTALARGVLRVLDQIDEGVATDDSITTIHALAVNTASSQLGWIDESITLANEQRAVCENFASIDLAVRERYDEILDAAYQLGFDRAADIIRAGRFDEFVSLDIEGLSYIGLGIQCLTEALRGIDDTRTRRRVTEIRDGLVGRQTVLEVAADDSIQAGVLGRVDKIQSDIDAVQRNAEVIKSIASQLETLLEKAGQTKEQISTAINEGDEVSAFKDKVDRLDVDAGGRLSDALERFSKHANAGVVLC